MLFLWDNGHQDHRPCLCPWTWRWRFRPVVEPQHGHWWENDGKMVGTWKTHWKIYENNGIYVLLWAKCITHVGSCCCSIKRNFFWHIQAHPGTGPSAQALLWTLLVLRYGGVALQPCDSSSIQLHRSLLDIDWRLAVCTRTASCPGTTK